MAIFLVEVYPTSFLVIPPSGTIRTTDHEKKRGTVRVTDELLPTDYQTYLHTIKTRIQQVQLQAVLAVNKELILLYWSIGKEILARQKKEGWGANVIGRLSRDLHAAFPQMKGFSLRNLGYMKTFAQAYPDEAFLQQLAAKIPWFHHCVLLDKVKDEKERLW